MMRVVTLIARKIFLGPKLCIPETVNPSMDAGFPVSVSYAMTFSAEENRIIFGNDAAIMAGKCIRVISMMTIQAP